MKRYTRGYITETAGVILAVFLMGCELPAYRVSGDSHTREVALLDSGVKSVVDSVGMELTRSLDVLAAAEKAAADEMTRRASSMDPAIQQARKDLVSLRAKYADAFKKMQAFRSFGGNSVFSEEDIGIDTAALMSQIAGRSYKGKAFSLETEGNMRRFIRRDLIPIENEIQAANARVKRFRNSQADRSQGLEEIALEYNLKRKRLVHDSNQELQKLMGRHRLSVATCDALGQFAFEGVHAGVYYLGVGETPSFDYLVAVDIRTHTFIHVDPDAGPGLWINKERENTKL